MEGKRGRAIIIGAGPGGLTASIALREAGFETEIFERSGQMQEIGSGLTLWPNAIEALDKLGLAGAVLSKSKPSAGIEMRSWSGTPIFSVRPASEFDDPDAMYSLAIHRGELQKILLAAAGETEIKLGARCTGFDQDERQVTAFFEDGTTARGDLLIAADGIRSLIRAKLFGNRKLRYAGYTVWRGVTEFHLKQSTGMTSIGRGAQFGLFPMTRGRVYWFASANAAEGDKDWPIGRKRELLKRFANWHEPIRAVIEATDEDAILRNDIYDMNPMRGWSKGRVTLLGDAAHPTTPGLGQGACQAIEDGVVLAACLNSEKDIGSSLKAYESRRIPRTRTITMQSRRMGQMGKWENPVMCWLRNMMMKSFPEHLMVQQLKKVFSFEG
jgi:2-polyprenyl-6-methoxyphenol hydroxylase-like FAD-dependent oxidoreductase